MKISLSPELEKAVQRKVEAGLFRDESEVISAALRQSIARENEDKWLERELALGLAQLESGSSVTVESEEQFMELIRRQP